MARTKLLWRSGLAALITLAIAGLGLLAYARTSTARPLPHTIVITASFYPLGEFARQVGGNKVSVHTLIKPGVEPHDYDPTPRDIAGIYTSKVFVYNGAGLEQWAGKLQADLAANKVVVVRASQGITLRSQDGGPNSPTDPHVWMDPVLAIKEVENIRDGFITADPTNTQTYQANANAYIAKLRQLDAAFRAGTASCELRDIVTAHQAFAYLGAEYRLHPIGIAGLSPEDEPSPQKLSQVADFVRARHVRYIFFETLTSPKLASTIATETGAQAITFNPLEGLTADQISAGKNYISVQKDNLQALRVALHCQ